ncbi:DUF6783 domain-containing protein [Lachnospiraceae bacterium JLR.KK009]
MQEFPGPLLLINRHKPLQTQNFSLYSPCARACLKIAFCKIPSQFASDYMLDLGGVVGYIDEIQHIIRCKVGRKIVGMNFQTRSSTSSKS